MVNRIMGHKKLIQSFVCGILSFTALTNGENVKATTLQTFFNKESFLEAAGGIELTMVDFELNSEPLPLEKLDTNTKSGTVKPGDIPPGVVFSSTGGNSNDLFLVPPNFAGNKSILTSSLFTAFSSQPLIVKFSPGVTAIGSDVFSFYSASTIVITVVDEEGQVSVFNVNPETAFPSYFGIVVTEGTITRIQYDPPSGFTTGIDNFQFGRTITNNITIQNREYILSLLDDSELNHWFNPSYQEEKKQIKYFLEVNLI